MKKHILIALIFTGLICSLQAAIPAGYEEQTLEGLNGKILKPHGWFYTAKVVGKSSLVYRITKEDSSKGEFLTGLTINVIPNVSKFKGMREEGGDSQETGNLDAKSAANAYLSMYKRSAKELQRDEPRNNNGFYQSGALFEKQMNLQGQAQLFKLGVTTFASVKDDLLIVMTFGTPAGDWETNKPIYETICSEIIIAGSDVNTSLEQATTYHSPVNQQDYQAKWRTYKPVVDQSGTEPGIVNIHLLTDEATLAKNLTASDIAKYIKEVEKATLAGTKDVPENSSVIIQCTFKTNVTEVATIGNVDAATGQQLHQALRLIQGPLTKTDDCTLDIALMVGQPTVYDLVDDPNDPLEILSKKVVQDSCHLIEVTRTNHVYQKAVPVAGSIPKQLVGADGPIKGTAFVVFQIRTNGEVGLIRVAKCSNPELEDPVTEIVQGFKLKPAVLDGKVVSVLAAQEFNFGEFKPPSIRFEGGDGRSEATAIKILGAKGESAGVASEYKWLHAHMPDAEMQSQALVQGDKVIYDVLTVTEAGKTQKVYFDITDYFGKL